MTGLEFIYVDESSNLSRCHGLWNAQLVKHAVVKQPSQDKQQIFM